MNDVIKDFQEHYHRFRQMLTEAQSIILNSDISDFPVFVFSKAQSGIGVGIYESRDLEKDWNVSASSLEELVAKNVISDGKIEDFKDVYKDPREYFCILVMNDEDARFAFPPIKENPFSEN